MLAGSGEALQQVSQSPATRTTSLEVGHFVTFSTPLPIPPTEPLGDGQEHSLTGFLKRGIECKMGKWNRLEIS